MNIRLDWVLFGEAVLCYMMFFDLLYAKDDAYKMVAAVVARTGKDPSFAILTGHGGCAMGPVEKKYGDVVLVATGRHEMPFRLLPIERLNT